MSILYAILLLPLVPSSSADPVQFTIRLEGETSPFPHNWEECVGSGHMTLALRSDYQAHLRRCHDELGFKRVRMHGMMDDDMSTSLGPGVNSYYNLDSVIDFTHSIGMDVLFEIGFMPEWLASNDTHMFHYRGNTSPPKDNEQWGKVMEELAAHLLDRYGPDAISRWYFEVWNEPTLGFWTGEPKQETYFEFYRATANAFHKVSRKFQMGGPVSNQLLWIPEFVDFCKQTQTPMSFVSSHLYAGGGKKPIFDADMLSRRFAYARQQVPAELPFIVSEWGGTYSHDEPLDEPSYASFIIAAIAQNVHNADIFSFWAFSDIFEEGGMPTGAYVEHPNFGLLTIYGTPKPSYRAFQLLHWTGDQRLAVERRGSDDACNQTLSALAVRNSTHFSVLVTNTGPLLPSSVDNVTRCTARISLPASRALTARIDKAHANPKAKWKKMGSPAYPSREQLKELERASELRMERITIEANMLEIVVPARGVFALFAELNDALIV
eukprot:TRINITY_DN55668_c0_g1_i1.p1 TRINITY_DN55668_c0_g1~~TRINITY_DN55668_c0_g1_i1.p1  ORF type:complete len:494 (+),score=63.62 TRINITY_DN55668_c0_g1_i1:33-1514(+)